MTPKTERRKRTSTDSRVFVLARLSEFRRVTSNLILNALSACHFLDGQIFRQTVTEWEEKFGALKREYLMERKQRENLTKILVEMSRDMKLLLNRNGTAKINSD